MENKWDGIILDRGTDKTKEVEVKTIHEFYDHNKKLAEAIVENLELKTKIRKLEKENSIITEKYMKLLIGTFGARMGGKSKLLTLSEAIEESEKNEIKKELEEFKEGLWLITLERLKIHKEWWEEENSFEKRSWIYELNKKKIKLINDEIKKRESK